MNTPDSAVVLRIDTRTAKLLRDALYGLGEHQAAGAPVPVFDSNDSQLLGRFLRDLDIKLGGTGRMA